MHGERRCRICWGDLHKHFDFSQPEAFMQSARDHLDFCGVLFYPFEVDRMGKGLHVESVRNRPGFEDHWNVLRNVAETYHDPGRFVTYLGYEWHGNRTRWGDHNVFWRDPADAELLDTWELPELYDKLRDRQAMAIPHHTGYRVGRRGKDWDVWDADLSPVMELYSRHGSSEGLADLLPLDRNMSMGPLAEGGTLQDALARGIRTGVIGSNDGDGLPGSWNRGLAGVWATENTREAVWEALLARRCYAVTGDRIKLEFHVNDTFMGGELARSKDLQASVRVECSQAIDRIELVQNGRVVQTQCRRQQSSPASTGDTVKVLIECGWGGATYLGWPARSECVFDGSARITGGRLIAVEARKLYLGQSHKVIDDKECRWCFNAPARGDGQWNRDNRQGLILTIEGTGDTGLDVQVNGERLSSPLRDLRRRGQLVAFEDHARREVQALFDVDPARIENIDVFYLNAKKVRIHRAVDQSAYAADVTFSDLQLEPGENTFYVRVSQVDGQAAWSSPVWIA